MKGLISRFFVKLLFFPALALIVLFLPLRYARRKIKGGKRSLWAGTPIITMPLKAKAERLLGIDSRTLVFHTYFITKSFDHDLSGWRVPVLGKLVPFAAFIYACVFYDRLHFFCDRGLLPGGRPFTFNFLELKVYKYLGIPVFLWTYGADVRSREATVALGEPNCCTECPDVGKACICNEADRARNISKLRENSTAIFSMGDMTEYTPGSRNDLFFWPVALENRKYEPAYPDAKAGRLRIVHAPNHRGFKGTHFLIGAVEKLKAEGVLLELVIVEGISNEKALDIYRSADLIFDQCLIGFHGYFAIEAMAMGKPVMCFIRKDEYLLDRDECPMIKTHVKTLEEDIRSLALKRGELREIGIRSRKYVEEHYTVKAFSARLGKAYRELNIK